MEAYVEKNAPMGETKSAQDMVGLRVLAASGTVLGRVRSIQLHHTTRDFEGVVVQGRKVGGACYVCASYIDRMTSDAVLLRIDPAITLVGKKVISSDGKLFGRVKEAHRVHQTNKIASLLVRRGLFRTASVPFSHVGKCGDSIILKKTYDEARRHGS